METAKIKLEMEQLRERDKKRREEIDHRKDAGEDCRRESDKST